MIHYQAGMGVELSKALNILAHEVRGPLGVIQGYLRLLRQRRVQDEDDTRMLTAMQDATGRLAALGRQAVDLAIALERPSLEGDDARIAEMVEAAVQQAALPAPPAVALPAPVGLAHVRFGRSPQVIAAIAALLQAVSKDAAGGPLAIVGTRRGDREIELGLGPRDRLTAAGDAPRSSDPGDLRLDRGGLGLSLVLASYVLDAIDARLSSIGSDGSAIAVTLRSEGGPQ
jgi:signal transduction histidine kinase